MFSKHVKGDISAFCHGELSAERARQVRGHLESCSRCRKEHELIRFGVAMAGQITRVPAPESLWSEVKARLEAPAAPVARVNRWGRALAYAMVLLLVAPVAFGLWYSEFRQRLEMVAASKAPSAFEATARDAHTSRLAGALEFDYVSDSPEALRVWLHQHAGFDVSLAINRPPEDAGRFQVLGAKVVQAGGARAALVGYVIDSRPVTLLAAPLGEVQDAPADARFKKRVAYRFDAERGVKLLTWGASGQAYVLVSDLPGRGTEACSICHTAPDRRELIRKARLKGGT